MGVVLVANISYELSKLSDFVITHQLNLGKFKKITNGFKI